MELPPFASRHIGPTKEEQRLMLRELGYDTVEGLLEDVVPSSIRCTKDLRLPVPLNESEALSELSAIMNENKVLRSFIGQGYYGCHTPGVIQRNILENPGWYTAYTPYQAELAQGRLEALINFQTLIADLTGLPVANSSLLDEGTAAAEAITLALSGTRKGDTVFVDENCHPQTIAVVETRCAPLNIKVIVGEWRQFEPTETAGLFAVLLQVPGTDGRVPQSRELQDFTERCRSGGASVIAATDLLALTIIDPPAKWGADIAIGSAQRFGVPFGYGGPHAAFIACSDSLKRKLPGRLVGLTKDSRGKVVYRLALQTREQHIRRDKATSNICTAQVLLAVMASMYAVYHGSTGLRYIATRVHSFALRFAKVTKSIESQHIFDTVVVTTGLETDSILKKARESGFLLRRVSEDQLSVSFDETSTEEELNQLCKLFGADCPGQTGFSITRSEDFLTHETFQKYRSETELLRYIKHLESKDLALNEAMIPLGSCTMKLNATSEMQPLSWPEVSQIHPFAPAECTKGYRAMLSQLEDWLAEITYFDKVSLQPNAGSQGEYAGLLAIKRYHEANQDNTRDICLIPSSAHGTNPASAVMAGLKVVSVPCKENGDIDLTALQELTRQHSDSLAALMVTYPSTHGVFEQEIVKVCSAVHEAGGLVYMDGANMNAQVGLTAPGLIGADVCHLNLHKTFCIPHGGGGPGVGPVCANAKLAPYLPGHAEIDGSAGAVCSAPYGSASINTISWMYIRMMGANGLKQASSVAILSANYLAKKMSASYPILFTGRNDLVAHECILDLRPICSESGTTVEDVAKRLADYSFHAPTMSWPVTGTLMVEPTESESLRELDRFVEAMESIREELDSIVVGRSDPSDNPLKNAPHPVEVLIEEHWIHSYSREKACFPVESLKNRKFWPSVGRVDNVYGDRNFACTCGAVEDYAV